MRRSPQGLRPGWRCVLAWLVVAAAVSFAVLPVRPDGALGAVGEPLDSGPSPEDVDARALASDFAPCILPAVSGGTTKVCAQIGDEQRPPHSPCLDRLLRPPQTA